MRKTSAPISQTAQVATSDRARELKLRLPATFEDGNMRTLERHSVWMERGKVVDFSTLEDLAGKLLQLGHVMEDPAFERRWCSPPQPPEKMLEDADRRRMHAEMTAMQKVEHVATSLRLAATDPAYADTGLPIAEQFRAEASKAIDELEPIAGQIAMQLREKLASINS